MLLNTFSWSLTLIPIVNEIFPGWHSAIFAGWSLYGLTCCCSTSLWVKQARSFSHEALMKLLPEFETVALLYWSNGFLANNLVILVAIATRNFVTIASNMAHQRVPNYMQVETSEGPWRCYHFSGPGLYSCHLQYCNLNTSGYPTYGTIRSFYLGYSGYAVLLLSFGLLILESL